VPLLFAVQSNLETTKKLSWSACGHAGRKKAYDQRIRAMTTGGAK